MQLIPESIATRKTIALDETWENRLALLRYAQLKIDFQNEPNIDKLKLWLEMFGGTIDETVVDTFTIDEYRRLLQSIILLFKLSGTVKSVELLGYVLGVTFEVSKGFVLKYDGQASYNGSFNYDSGGEFSPFIISIKVSNYSANFDFDAFKAKLMLLFEIFEPVWIFIQKLEFVEAGFPYTLPLILGKHDYELPAVLPVILQ